MRYIQELREGSSVNDIYLCRKKQSMTTKNGKNYDSLMLQDKTGSIDAKVWDPNSGGIAEFDELDYIHVMGDVTSFQGRLQLNVRRIMRVREGDYNPADYLPVSSRDIDEMYKELLKLAESVKNPYLHELLQKFFVTDERFAGNFKASSAAKSVHHGFVGGLLEHTCSVTRFAVYVADSYPAINRDLLITASLLHDIGKTKELSYFPMNEYTDDGQLLGHIMIGAEMIHDKASKIEGFPELLETELKHCILAHHGEYEYGSPKKPALIEALALNLIDNLDAKLETMTEVLENAGTDNWLGFNRFFESNLRKTEEI